MSLSGAFGQRLALAAVVLAASCGEAPKPDPEPLRPVRVMTVEPRQGGETVSLTGRIEPEDSVTLSFRVGGAARRPVGQCG